MKTTEEIRSAAEETEFTGVISLNMGERTIFREAFGYRDRANRLENQRDTKFGIASGTKLFTALAMGALIDRGIIGLGTKVREIDSSFCTFIDGEATVFQLLTHTSGIYDYFDEELVTDFNNFHTSLPWYDLETPTDYLPLFEGKKSKFPPGERFSYSNGGYVFLGILIEKLSGRTFRDFIEETVLRPADMADSGFFALNDLPENTANGYREDGTTNIFALPIRGGGDGGLFTTALDLRRFWHCLFDGRIISWDLLGTFLETHVPFSETDGYGCGIYTKRDGSRYALMGSDAGVGFYSHYLPDKQLSLSILSNETDGEEGMKRFLLE